MINQTSFKKLSVQNTNKENEKKKYNRLEKTFESHISSKGGYSIQTT